MRLLIPCRANLLGGWSDLVEWDEHAAVLNVAIGWNVDGWQFNPYPCVYDYLGFSTIVNGHGSGLGISSIREAAKLLYKDPGGDYIQHTLQAEQEEGTRGGWQDQIGAISPGMKLIQTDDHRSFDIRQWPDWKSQQVVNRMVLFDSGKRRASKDIGDQVREALGDHSFRDALRKNIDDARCSEQLTVDDVCSSAIRGFGRLAQIIPDMDPGLELVPDTLGYMFLGAGGGGFGVYFATSDEARPIVCERLIAQGLFAYLPVMLDGIKREDRRR